MFEVKKSGEVSEQNVSLLPTFRHYKSIWKLDPQNHEPCDKSVFFVFQWLCAATVVILVFFSQKHDLYFWPTGDRLICFRATMVKTLVVQHKNKFR